MTKPVTGQTTFGASTSGTTTQLDNNFLLAYNALNDLNTYKNYFTDTGAANAYVVTLAANLTGALSDGLIIQMKATNANTGASTLNYNGTGAIPIVDVAGASISAGSLPAGGIVQLQYSSAAASWLLQTPLSSAAALGTQVPVRQVVLTGPLSSTTGLPTLLPTSCTSLTLNATNANATTPVVVAAANGFTMQGGNDRVGSTTGNLTWTNLTANTINYLAVTVNANQTLSTTFTTVAPVYQFGGSASNGNGNYTFNIQQMQMQAGNGTATAQAFTVFVGEANCNSNAVISAINYAYMARYQGAFTANLPSAAAVITANHAVGVPDVLVEFEAENTTTENGFAVGDRLAGSSIYSTDGSARAPLSVWKNYRQCGLTVGSAGSPAFGVDSKTNGTATTMTTASWKYRFTAARKW